MDLWGERNFLVRILISRGFESVNTVFGADFVFGRKNSSSPTTEGKNPECDVVKHGAYTELYCTEQKSPSRTC